MATITYNEQVLTDLEHNIDDLIHDVAQECLHRVADRTPVRTGYARSRWQVAEDSSGFELSNDAEYISFLEDGSSTQAPSGMLAITMMEVPDIVEDKARKYRKE